MTALLPIISLLLVVACSLIIVRIATVALTLTGLSRQLARFQARSAFTGAGFTTTESEQVIQHPVRRRIIMLLMLLGNAGIVSAVSTLIISMTGAEGSGVTESVWFRLLFVVTGLALVWWIAHSRWIDQRLSKLIEWGLTRWTDLDARDYAGLLHLSKGFSVVEMGIESDDWIANRELSQLRLDDEGVLVLGIERADGAYVGIPRGDTVLRPEDVALLYGPQDTLENLDQRRSDRRGNREHVIAVEKCQQAKQFVA